MTADEIIDDVLRRELPPGVRTWNASRALLQAADRGGWTRGGITGASWGQYKGWGRTATAAELDAISEADARAFYAHRHVHPFDAYPDPLRILLIDFGVTSSHLSVFKALQQALRDMGLYSGTIDGKPGELTRAAVAAATPRELYLRTLEYRARHYIALSFDEQARGFLRANPRSQLANMRGWLARCLPFTYDAP